MGEGDCVGTWPEHEMGMGLEAKGAGQSVRTDGRPLPVVDAHVDLPSVTRLLSKNPAVLVRREGKLHGIVTRYDVMRYVTGA